jgi:chemotaxis protein MotB
MAKKHKHPEHENLERWLVSYADFMTLLFATFTALYALAQTDAAKLKDVGEAIREGFEEQSIMNGIKSIMQGHSAPNRNPDPLSSEKGAGAGVIGKFDSMTYQPGEVKSMQHLVDTLTSDLKGVNDAIKAAEKGKGGTEASRKGSTGESAETTPKEDANTPIRSVEAGIQERGIRISFDSRMLFDPASAALKTSGEKALDVVAERLKKYDNRRIHVEGHTDNLPIATAIFPSNWELSAARASSVVRYFIGRHAFNPAAMVAVGYADTQPVSSNKTPEGRTENRRVDIILYNEKATLLLNPRVQYLKEQPITAKAADLPLSHTPILPVLPNNPKDGPVRVIIKDKDGTERVLVPKTHALVPLNPLGEKSGEKTVKPDPRLEKPSVPKTSVDPKFKASTIIAHPKETSTLPPVPGKTVH